MCLSVRWEKGKKSLSSLPCGRCDACLRHLHSVSQNKINVLQRKVHWPNRDTDRGVQDAGKQNGVKESSNRWPWTLEGLFFVIIFSKIFKSFFLHFLVPLGTNNKKKNFFSIVHIQFNQSAPFGLKLKLSRSRYRNWEMTWGLSHSEISG